MPPILWKVEAARHGLWAESREALHEIPDLIGRWRDDGDSLGELRMYLREYDEHWGSPKLEVAFLTRYSMMRAGECAFSTVVTKPDGV